MEKKETDKKIRNESPKHDLKWAGQREDIIIILIRFLFPSSNIYLFSSSDGIYKWGLWWFKWYWGHKFSCTGKKYHTCFVSSHWISQRDWISLMIWHVFCQSSFWLYYSFIHSFIFKYFEVKCQLVAHTNLWRAFYWMQPKCVRMDLKW